jgi:hypothetical protein
MKKSKLSLSQIIKNLQEPSVGRDLNILLLAKGEVNMKQKSIKSKRAYTRKSKHKNKEY